MAREGKSKRGAAGKSPLERARARMYHDLLFETAERVFAAQGFDEATMQDVASAAGVSLKTLYATFPGKNEIYAEIVMERGLAFLEAVGNATRDGSALERLEGLTRASVSYLLEHEPFRRILLHEGRAWGLDPRTEASRDAWRAGVEHVARTLRLGMEEGVFHEEDAELLAGTVQAMLQVQLAGRLDRAEGEPDPERIAGEILVILRRMLCRDPDGGTRERAVA